MQSTATNTGKPTQTQKRENNFIRKPKETSLAFLGKVSKEDMKTILFTPKSMVPYHTFNIGTIYQLIKTLDITSYLELLNLPLEYKSTTNCKHFLFST